MKAKILYLYYDFLNLYGDNGNVSILEKRLKDQGFEVEIVRKTVTDDAITFEGFDLIYCGSGTESRRAAATTHLKRFEKGFAEAVSSGTPILFTGNSWGMLGKSITTLTGEKIEGLGIFDFELREEIKKRFTGDAVETADGFDRSFIGFIKALTDTLSRSPRRSVRYRAARTASGKRTSSVSALSVLSS